MSLTVGGRELYDRGLQVLAALDEAEASVSARTGKSRGVLRITGKLLSLRAWRFVDLMVERVAK